MVGATVKEDVGKPAVILRFFVEIARQVVHVAHVVLWEKRGER